MHRHDGDANVPTREIILDAAERLFSARGVDGVAVRDLARELGLTPSSLYNYFPSKQALYDAVLERGLRPIVELVSAAWQPGTFQRDRMRATLDGLVTHLSSHPHLAQLMQRALLSESESVRALIARWVAPLYGTGVAVIKEAARDAGWEPEELPHLALGLYGVIFAYFANASVIETMTGVAHDPSPQNLAVQRRFLEKAVFRLLGPRTQHTQKKGEKGRGRG